MRVIIKVFNPIDKGGGSLMNKLWETIADQDDV
jgi:hypothetical protein